MTFKISLFDSAKDNAPQSVDVDWETLLKELQTHETRTTKDGNAWSPARFEGTRSNDNARAVSLGVFDLDDCSDEVLAQLGERLAPYTYALHSTFTAGCYRLVLPLDVLCCRLSGPKSGPRYGTRCRSPRMRPVRTQLGSITFLRSLPTARS